MKKLFLFMTILPLTLSATEPTESTSTSEMIPGVNYSFPQATAMQGMQSCNFISPNFYQCSDVAIVAGHPTRITTPINDFKSAEDLCGKLSDASINSVLVSGIAMQVARVVRSAYLMKNCAPQSEVTNPIVNPLLRNMTCRLNMTTIDGSSGDTGFIKFPVMAGGSRFGFYAVMAGSKEGSGFKFNTYRNSSRYLNVNIGFKKDKNDSEQIEIRADIRRNIGLQGSGASISGDARSGVSLSFESAGDIEKAEVQCVVTDATENVAEQQAGVVCRATGTDSIENKGSVVNTSIESLLGNQLNFTDSNARSSVKLGAEIPGVAKYQANFVGTQAVILGKANLNKKSEFKIAHSARNVTVGCK